MLPRCSSIRKESFHDWNMELMRKSMHVVCLEKVFKKTAPFATLVLDGFNVCIFAYGQTGSSKTFIMEAVEGARGVNHRTLEEPFRIFKEREGLF
uniref:Kinesin motor domain-containing protein n=1 Tax=Arundo donax TaxID=35708 RepID=A0A0A9GW92_ARUDO